MSDQPDDLRAAFEERGYDVGEASVNRNLVRITILDEGAEAERLRSIVADVLGEEPLGLNVTTEAIEGQDAVGTVVSFRRR